MLYLWIARHGLTQHNVDGIIQGHYDSDLNAEGRLQAELLAEHLEKQVRLDAIFTSPLKRAKDTALAIHRLQPQAKFIIDGVIIERNMGVWNNRKIRRKKPKKIKSVGKDPQNEREEATEGILDQNPTDQAQGNLVTSGQSMRAGFEQLSIASSKENTRQEDNRPGRERSERSKLDGGHHARVPDRVVLSNRSGLPRETEKSSDLQPRVTSSATESASEKAERTSQEKHTTPVRRKVPGMEDRSDVEDRCDLWMRDALRPFWLASLKTSRDIHILLVSHGAFISTMIDVLMLPVTLGGWGFLEVIPRIDHCFNTSITKFAIDKRGTGLLLVSNNIDHLEAKATFCDPQDFAHDVIRREMVTKA